MKHLRLLALASLLLIIASMVLSELHMEAHSIASLALSFIPMAIYCHILDKHERKAE